MLRPGPAVTRLTGMHHPHSWTISPALRRLWTGGVLALLSLLFTSTGPAFAQQGGILVVTEPEGVNLRGGPGIQYLALTVVPVGEELTILGPKMNERWYPTRYGNQMGFVFDEYVKLKSSTPPAGAPAVTAASPTPTTAIVTPAASATPTVTAAATATAAQRVLPAEGVNLRAGPSTEQSILLVIPQGTRLTPVTRSSDGRWVNVVYGGQTGWVDSQYLGADDRPAESGSARYIWPVAGRSITTYFSGSHRGIDIDQYPSGGSPVVAVADGRVTFAGGNPCCSYGIYVTVEHGDGMKTLYAHLQSLDVREGQVVRQGDMLGRSGNTGNSTGAHLHFEMQHGSGAVDPLAYLGR